MGDSGNMLDFGFAFDDKDFSDRVLNIEIIPEEIRPLNPTDSKDSDCFNGVILKTIHISSPILAVKSPFFYKLFKNDMKEAQQRDVTLKINSTELSSLMDLLNFIYNNTLSATTSSELLGVLMSADKFEVPCCMKHCVKAMLELPMSQESAVSYLELPSSVSTSEVVQPLIDASKKYLVACYMNFDRSWTMYMASKLPLCAIEAILGSDGLQVSSEDVVHEFILAWARKHYPKMEERREILTKRLTRLVCYANMSCSRLKEALVCPDFDHEQVSKLVTEALFAKDQVPYGHASKDLTTTNHNTLPRRVYTYRRPMKVVRLESPWPHSIVYLNLTKDECVNLFPSKKSLYSDSFLLGGWPFYLRAECHEEPPHHFGLYLCREKGSETCIIDYEFSVMHKSSKDFQSKFKSNNCIFETEDDGCGEPNLFGMPWTEFMSDDCEYFINGILHLRAELTVVNS